MTDGSILQVNIEREMRDAYLDYAMSVIVSRALPDARDGLKPVHRRILYAMHDMGIRAESAHKKSARIVGEVLGKYHPHGDSAVYESMVRMAQDFSLRYMLIDGQGNFGSIDGDSAAAMRYTEARMANIGGELLIDIGKDTVDFVENFDGTLNEPAVLPSAMPNMLINGSSGIAVGMSTNIPPHNLGEVCDALVYMLSHWNRIDDIDVEELMHFVKGPDFPTGGVVYKMRGDEDMLNAAYATGRGKITMRAKVHIEDMGRGKSRIIVSELPYQTNKTTLIERIASLVHSGKLEGLADLRDESDRQNAIRLVIELQRGVDSTEIMAALFKLTPLQSTFGIIMLALVDNEPRLLTLKQSLWVYLEHRLEVMQRRSHFDLARAKERAHILEGLLIALNNLDEVIATIRKSRNTETARNNLMKKFKVTEVQAQAILDMPLRRLASLEVKKIQEEYDEKIKLIRSLEDLLESPQQQRIQVAEELVMIKTNYGDKRRSVIVDGIATAVTAEDFLMPEENTWVMFSVKGHVARTFNDEPPRVTTSTKVPPYFMQESSTSHILYLFTDKGNCATIPVQQLPQADEVADGMHFRDLCPLDADETIVSLISLPMNINTGYLVFATEQGQVKRLQIEELPGAMSIAFVVMKVSKEDKLKRVMYTSGENEIVLTTARAQTIRFSEDDVRPTGLPAGGVRGIKLVGQRDRVTGVFLSSDNLYTFNITNDGIAKTSAMNEYPSQGRAGSGVISMRLPAKSRDLAAAAVGRLDDTMLVLTSKNKAKYMRLGLAETIKRGRAGDDKDIISLRENEEVVAVVNYESKIIPVEVEESEIVDDINDD
jgi:DNA gyrase subunit A